MGNLLRKHPLLVFFVLAYGLTWAVWIPRAAGVEVGVIGQLWTWMPAVAAVLAAMLTGGRAAVTELLRRLVRWVGFLALLALSVGVGRMSHDKIAQDLVDVVSAIWKNILGLLVTSGFVTG